MALRSTDFADVLDVRFRQIWDERFEQLPDMVATFYNMDLVSKPGRQTERYSTVGTLPELSQFSGTVSYNDVFQGYDMSISPLEFTGGIQIERRLFDDDQHMIIDAKPKALAGSTYRTRQVHAARPFNNAFSVDTFFASHTEGVALSSNSHTTTSGASVASGFDNLDTTALSAVSVAANRIKMVQFRGDQAERIAVMPNAILVPPDLYEIAYEISASQGKGDTAHNHANVHYGQYEVIEWNYLTDTNNWFMLDTAMMKDMGLIWVDRVKGEFAFVEDFDTLTGKWRVYARWGSHWMEWRWVNGNSVS